MPLSPSGDWSRPFLLAFAFVFSVTFLLPHFAGRLSREKPEKQRLVANVVPQPKPEPVSQPQPEATPSPSPVPTPMPPEPSPLSGSEVIVPVEFNPEMLQVPGIPYATFAFLKERKEAIVALYKRKQAQANEAASNSIIWPESMPAEYKRLVLPGSLDTKVRYFGPNQTGLDASQLDYVSEASIKDGSGKIFVTRWTVTIRFFASEDAAKEDYRNAVADLVAPDSEVRNEPVKLGDEAVQGQVDVGSLGQKDRVYVVRLGAQVLEMQTSAGAPAEVQPAGIVGALKELLNRP